MRYLVIQHGYNPFWTHWFDPENNYVEGMTVIDMEESLIYQGDNWIGFGSIAIDHL